MLFAVSSADGHKPLRYEEPYNESAMRQAGAGLGRLSTNIEAVKKEVFVVQIVYARQPRPIFRKA
jgi:hypothetical protein